jgi:hypothetical protein
VAAGAGSVGCDALLLALVRASGCRLTGEHLPTGEANTHILRAVEGARKTLPLRSAVRVLGLSLSQYHAWKRADRACDLADQPSCPKRFPGQLTAREVTTIDEAMSTRHLLDVQVTPTGPVVGDEPLQVVLVEGLQRYFTVFREFLEGGNHRGSTA